MWNKTTVLWKNFSKKLNSTVPQQYIYYNTKNNTKKGVLIMRARRTRINNEREVIYYAFPNVTEELVSDVAKWLKETNTLILHNYDFATPDHDVWQLFDRGFEIVRDGKFAPEAYRELKKIAGIDDSDHIAYEFFEELEDRELAEKNILDDDD